MAKLLEFVAIVRDMSREAFVESHPHAFVLHRRSQASQSATRRFTTAVAAPEVGKLVRAITGGEAKLSDEAAHYEAYPVIKRGDSPWAGRISIGRTRTNDIVVEESAVSKLHAYIQGEPPEATIMDVNSRNGVTVNGVKLSPNTPAPIASGAAFSLGSVAFVYYDAGAFFDFVRSLLR